MAKFVPQAELPVSEQAQIRRDKLAALQAEGRDPFVQTKYRSYDFKGTGQIPVTDPKTKTRSTIVSGKYSDHLLFTLGNRR